MTMTTAKQLALGVVAVAALVAPGVSQAGDATQYVPECVKYTDGSGYCRGSMKGFRNSTYADAWVQFETDVATGWTYFFARYNGLGYGCYPDTASSARFASAMASNGYFMVRWNASAVCTNMYVFNESAAY